MAAQDILSVLDDVQRHGVAPAVPARPPRAARTPTGGDILSVLDQVQSEQSKPAAAESTDRRSLFARGFDAVFTPPEVVTRAAGNIADRVDSPSLDRGPLAARARGFAAGAVEGVSNLLTPGDVALTALGYGPLSRFVRAIRGGAEVAEAVQRAANVATAARGVERVADAESLPDAAAGVAQVALGAAGARPGAAPVPHLEDQRALPSGARFVAAPDGRVAAAGADIPMTQAPDGSFVRGVPAEPARRIIRGELPAGPRFVAGPAGVAAVDKADSVLAVLDDVQGVSRGPDPSHVHSIQPAVLEREIDPTVPAREGVRVRQYASDPAAVDAPFLSADELGVLRVMRDDLATFAPERGRLITDPNDPGSSIYAHGGPGSPVGDDVRTISEQNVGNQEIAAAIDDLLAGKEPSNRLHTAAIDAARGYMEGRSGYRGPVLPLESEVAHGATAGLGGEPVGADDFEAFSRIFDDIDPEPHGEPGESGFITSQLATHLGGGAAGATLGAASGEDTEDRVRRGVLYGIAGAVAPAVLRRGSVPHGTPAPRPRATVLPMPERGDVPRVSRSGRPVHDPMRGVDVLLEKFSNPLVRTGIEERLIANKGYTDQRRGVIGSEMLGKVADAVKVDVSRVLPKGSAVSGEVITAYARAAAATQRKVSDLAAVVNSGKATDEDLVRLAMARADADVVLKSLMGLRAEAGRALASFRFLDGVLDTGKVDLIRGAAQQLRDDAEKFGREFSRQPNDPLHRYQWLQNQGKASWWDKTRSYYYSSILSGVKTHERNILGNVFNAIGNTVAHPFAAGIDAARAVATGKPRDVLFSELPHGVVGAAAGIERGFSDALFTLRHGVSPQALDRSLKTAEVGKLDLPRVEFGGGAANPLNWPGRSLDAADVFFRSVARNAELYESAYTQAIKEGKRGPALVDRVAELRAGLTPEGAALRENAEHVAARAVFQEKGGPITSWLAQGYRVPGIGQAMTFVMPFLRTPGNIIRQGLETSPAGFGMKAARQAGRAGRFAQGKAAMGSVAAGYLAWLAATGRLSGNGPTDSADRAALMESGWRPNSVRIGDKWVSYQLMQPISVQAALIANGFEAWAEQGAKGESAPTVAAQTLARSANSFLDQSFLSGLFDLSEALKDPERSAGRWAGRFAQSMTPFSGLQRTVRDAMDPVQRAPRSVMEQAKSGTPGLSSEVPPRIDRFGEVVTREGGQARRALDPFNTSSATTDPVADELSRLGVSLSLPSRSVAGQQVTRSQEIEIQQRRGRAVRESLERLIATAGYQRMSDKLKVEVVERAIEAARRRETQRIARDLRRRIAASASAGSR